MKAKIKDNAYELYWKNLNKTFRGSGVPPKTYLEFGETIKSYIGIVMEVNYQYGNRTRLTYPEPKQINIDGNIIDVVGIDLENYLLDFIEEE